MNKMKEEMEKFEKLLERYERILDFWFIFSVIGFVTVLGILLFISFN